MADQDQKQSEAPEEAAASESGQADKGQAEAKPGNEGGADQGAAQAGVEETEAGAEAAGDDSDEVARLQEELAQLKDAALRAQAEAQNTQRRAEMDVEKARKFALESFSKELLPVVDNLERALESVPADNPDVKPFAEGVELTLKSLLDALGKFKIEAVDPEGEPFDPQLHQAMSMVENPEVEPNTVIAVMQKGYTLNGRLVRPAMVMVSKAAQ